MNRSDEVKIKDLPIAEQFNANDHMIIDVGAGVVRTMTMNYPKFVAWYQK